MAKVRFTGIGSFTPARRITNQDWEKLVATTDDWIRQNVGIVQRSRIDAGSSTVEMGHKAALVALEKARLPAESLERVLCATNTQGYLYPSTASQIQEKLGAKNAAAMDIQAGCTGWLYAVQLASALISADQSGPVLIVGTDALSTAINLYDRSSLLFGDGAGAAVVVPQDSGAQAPAQRLAEPIFSLRTMPSMAMQQATIIKEENNRLEDYLSGKDMSQVERPLARMDGKGSLRLALTETRACLDDVLTKAKHRYGIESSDIDLFVPHQTNAKVVQALCEHVGFPLEKIPYTLDKYGGISTASIPTGLNEHHNAGKIRPGDLVLACAYGAGFTSGAVLFEWRVND